MNKMSSRKPRCGLPNHLPHLTWLAISSHLRRRDELISATRVARSLRAAPALSAHREEPKEHLFAASAAEATRFPSAGRPRFSRSCRIHGCFSKSKKKVAYVPGPHGRHRGQGPQAIAALTVLYTTRGEKSLFGPPAICQCGRTKAPFWLGSSPSRRASEQC